MDKDSQIKKENLFNGFLCKSDSEVRILLKKALAYVTADKKALEIGAGMLYDTRHLLEEGFTVVAIDPSELTPLEAEKIHSKRLTIFNDIVEHYPFPKKYFDLVSAQYSLMYVTPECFDEVFTDLTDSLVSGGVLAMQLFGPDNDMPWLSKDTLQHDPETIENLLSEYEIIFVKEFKGEIESVNGTKGFAHDFRIVARKR